MLNMTNLVHTILEPYHWLIYLLEFSIVVFFKWWRLFILPLLGHYGEVEPGQLLIPHQHPWLVYYGGEVPV